MKKFIFTFYQAHPLKNYCQPVIASSYTTARNRMVERYGNSWGFQYTEKEWNKWKRKASLLGIKIETELNPMYCREDED